MTGRIVLLGATGYTGGRTAQAMVDRGLSPVLAGRDPDRLAGIAHGLGGLQTARADVTDPASIRALVEKGDVLVPTVGPFLRPGGPAIAAAVEAGTCDTPPAGALPDVRELPETHGTFGRRPVRHFADDVPKRKIRRLSRIVPDVAPRPICGLRAGLRS